MRRQHDTNHTLLYTSCGQSRTSRMHGFKYGANDELSFLHMTVHEKTLHVQVNEIMLTSVNTLTVVCVQRNILVF